MIIGLVMAGGFGKRLWPLSTKNKPKQFLTMLGKYSCFQHAILNAFSVSKHVIVSCNIECQEIVRNQLFEINITDVILIIEPFAINTAAATIIAALVVQRIHKKASIMVFPSDQILGDIGILQDLLKKVQGIKDKMVLFGIEPLWIENNYGYIFINQSHRQNPDIFMVEKFIEKPNINLINKMSDKIMYWNSGIFLFPIDFFLIEIKKISKEKFYQAKNIYRRAICFGQDIYLNLNNQQEIFNQSIDYFILEQSNNLMVSKLNTTWRDLGSWNSLLDFFYHKFQLNNSIGEIVLKSWGHYVVIARGERFLIKIIVIAPGHKTSMQYHNHRAEHFTIKEGIAEVTIGNEKKMLKKDDWAYVNFQEHHQISNISSSNILKIFEIQIGDVLSEQDIVRIKEKILTQ